jgi:hypothetical protein
MLACNKRNNFSGSSRQQRWGAEMSGFRQSGVDSEVATGVFRVVVVASLALAFTLSWGSAPAFACDTGYWNIGCQSYSPTEGHSAYQFGPDSSEWTYSTFTTYDTVLMISTTAGGSWTSSGTTTYGVPFYFMSASDKVGCYNHHTGSMWVNCRHNNYYF